MSGVGEEVASQQRRRRAAFGRDAMTVPRYVGDGNSWVAVKIGFGQRRPLADGDLRPAGGDEELHDRVSESGGRKGK